MSQQPLSGTFSVRRGDFAAAKAAGVLSHSVMPLPRSWFQPSTAAAAKELRRRWLSVTQSVFAVMVQLGMIYELRELRVRMLEPLRFE